MWLRGSWALVLAVGLVYGFGWHNGLYTGGHTLKDALATLVLTPAVGYLVWLWRHGQWGFAYRFSGRHLITTGVLMACSGTIASYMGVLPMELIADEQWHLASAHAWGLWAADRGWLPAEAPRTLMWLALGSGLAAIAGLFALAARLRPVVSALLVALAFGGLRWLSVGEGTTGFQPPLMLLPGWLAGLLPPHAFRLLLLGWHSALLAVFRHRLGLPLWAVALIALHPLYAANAVAYEASLYTFFALGGVLLLWLKGRPGWALSPGLWVALSLLALARHPAFVAWVPAGLAWLMQVRRQPLRHWQVLLPLVPALVFVANAVLTGTPAMEVSIFNQMPADPTPAPLRIWHSLTEGTGYTALLKHLGLAWLALLPLGLLVAGRRVPVWLVSFAVAYAVFFAVRPFLLGHNRYQLEYALPFALPLLWWLRSQRSRMLAVAAMALLLWQNILLTEENTFPRDYIQLFAHSTLPEPVHLTPNLPYRVGDVLQREQPALPVYIHGNTHAHYHHWGSRQAYDTQRQAQARLDSLDRLAPLAPMPPKIARVYRSVVLADQAGADTLAPAYHRLGWHDGLHTRTHDLHTRLLYRPR